MTERVDEPAGVPEHSGPGGLVRLRLDVAYDGAGFHGWARQPALRSVQGELEAALRAVLRVPVPVPVRVAVAGRTDAGVHAIGQVCHCDVPAASWAAVGSAHPEIARPTPPSLPTTERSDAPTAPGAAAPDPPTAPGAAAPATSSQFGGLPVLERPQPATFVAEAALRRRLNGVLPADVRVRRAGVAPDGFDARWSALWRRYEYLVADDPDAQDPRARGHVLWHPRRLDVAAMVAAARPFVGEHDFAAFCRAREGASTVRTVHEIGWRRGNPAGPGDQSLSGWAGVDLGVVGFGIRADAFCHSMVRALVGAFLAVGDGRWPIERPAELLADGVRVPAITTAPAHGLTLVEVGYPGDADLAAQAARAKRWRGR